MITYDVKDTLENNIVSLGIDFNSDEGIAFGMTDLTVLVADIILPDGRVGQVHLSLVTERDNFIESDIMPVIDLSGGQEAKP